MASARLCGSFAQVARGVDEHGEPVALKTVLRSPSSLSQRDAVAQGGRQDVSREEHLLRLVPHVNVVRLLGSRITPEGASQLVLEWCETDLARVLCRRTSALSHAVVKALFDGLLRALSACHAAHVLHRDVKPANLLLGRDGCLKLADFGNACVLSPDGRASETGSTTRWYRPPELLCGGHTYHTGVDQWSAGCVLAELLGGVPLLPGASDLDQLAKVQLLLGPPDQEDARWLHEHSEHASQLGILASSPRVPIEVALPDAPRGAVDLIGKLLRYAAPARASAETALGDAWFSSPPLPLPRVDVRAALLAE